jgi:hypothetical protein
MKEIKYTILFCVCENFCRRVVQVFLLIIGQVRYRPLLPIGWRIVQILRERQRKTTNTAPTTLSAIQAASQSLSIHNLQYSTCD